MLLGLRILGRYQQRLSAVPRFGLWRPGAVATVADVALDVSVCALILRTPGAGGAHDAALGVISDGGS
ncbi:hypothetical protein LO772_20745 [Yinghuangia sp. ASG 101]|uniref:hypothetical protein n=1 Tax=Yinghuangia sp. ASG 101 TaxID=2896848 RepID=UPI001E5C3C84|nr:hypothetical protein [Yinghuangia sp. ASG 101]UGQ09363.1 hypothetical protein LO772_20745 [Yinghuangia sp. ASG 101]